MFGRMLNLGLKSQLLQIDALIQIRRISALGDGGKNYNRTIRTGSEFAVQKKGFLRIK